MLSLFLPPLGQDLQLTIVSTDGDATENARESAGSDAERTADDRKLDSIGDMFAALRACWVPPPKDEARHGMEYTIRFAFKRDGEVIAPPRMTYATHDAPAALRDIFREAIDAALQRCTPLHFSAGMAGAVAGRRSPSASSTSARPIRTAGNNPRALAHFHEFPRVSPLIPA